jgi:tetratricopeptide (TPR) repeat protein
LSALLIIVLLPGGCRKAPPISPEAAENLLATAHATQALTAAERGLADFPSPAQPEHWRFRMVQISALKHLERFDERKRLLQQLSLPPGVPITRAAAQFRLAQAPTGASLDALLSASAAQGLADIVRHNEIRLAVEAFEKDPQKGRARVDAVLRESRAAGDVNNFAYAAGELGFLLAGRFQLDEALRMFDEVRKVSGHAGEILLAAYADANIGWLYQLTGQEERAIAAFEAASRTFEKLGVYSEHRLMLRNLGGIAFYRGDYRKAGEFFEQARKLVQKESDPKSVAGLLSDLAANAAALGDVKTAEQAITEASRIEGHRETFEYPWILLTRGRIAEIRGQDPLPLYREAAALTSRDRTAALEAYLRIANFLRSKQQPREAEAAYREALQSVSRLRAMLQQEDSKMGFVSTTQRIYQEWVDFLIETGREQQALIAADESRLQVFTETQAAPLRIDRLAAALAASKSTALVYWLGPKRSFAWTVDAEGARLSGRLPAASVIEGWVRSHDEFVKAGRDPRQSQFEAPRRLFEELVAKVGAASSERVVIVPDGALHWLNFETLPVEHGKLWLETARISVAPALRILRTEGASGVPGSRALLVGDAAAQGKEFPALQHAGGELREIASLYSAATLLAGPRATPEAYRSADPSQFDVLHFAAHAEANVQSPLDSSVILSPDAGGAFRLLTRDAMKKPLRAQLVTLSACKAAGAKAFAGEGLVGFSWAFLRSGARQVVAGLWQVDDESTLQLMRSFYSAMRVKRLAPADALREAKLQMLHSGGPYAKPYYWGPFQIFTSIMR